MPRTARARAGPLLAAAAAVWGGAAAFAAPRASGQLLRQPPAAAELPPSAGSTSPEAVESLRQTSPDATWFRSLVAGAALGLVAAAFVPAASAADLKNGEAVFNNICAACHVGGDNLVSSEKTLKADALAKNGRSELANIKAIVAGGNGAMPALGQILDATEIDDVANYVLGKSKTGWK
ncbi:unnamed protein product [Prorocentrum cordatum]|uniref:Cytochrome c-553 n=1 Tax=Prorocentrum cordatum TaxID=2364126 RepID=A0ABN9TB61_9DINO|nr:unnamed protein product [Polarella glacialis]|mmetsp:Transcript_65488/g.170455  ORF Transcript_65488/g.170455 Transcript_65488/m.170455 type:complete len:179 (-) Transcript_65488:234-770(-)